MEGLLDPESTDVEPAVEAGLPAGSEGSALARMALLVARRLDQGVECFDTEDGRIWVQVSARDTAGLVKELRAVLADLRLAYPPAVATGRVASIQEQRDKRRAAP